MKAFFALTLATTLSAVSAMADTRVFRSIIGEAANIERDATAISQALRVKNPNAAIVQSEIEKLGNDIAALRQQVAAFEANAANLTPRQQADWELVKTKIQLLEIFHDRKQELVATDLRKNRSMLRAHADGIAKRARMLQETANRLDR